jgi:hypothetical protein
MCYLMYHSTCSKCGQGMYNCKCEDDNEWLEVAKQMQEDINESERQRHDSNS